MWAPVQLDHDEESSCCIYFPFPPQALRPKKIQIGKTVSILSCDVSEYQASSQEETGMHKRGTFPPLSAACLLILLFRS